MKDWWPWAALEAVQDIVAWVNPELLESQGGEEAKRLLDIFFLVVIVMPEQQGIRFIKLSTTDNFILIFFG